MSPVARMVVGAVTGGVLGFLAYRFIGCRTGACPLTANPYVAVVIWGLMGALVAMGK